MYTFILSLAVNDTSYISNVVYSSCAEKICQV